MDFDWTFFTYDENVTVIDGQSSDIVIHTSLVRPNEESQTWCHETKLIVEISQEQAGSVTVENLSIDIDSLSPIYPFQVQFLDQDQNIIYDAPGSKFMMYHPTLYITNDTYPHTDYYQRDPYMKGRTNNGTAYLPAGNYTFLFAWDDSWIYQISNLTSVLLQPNTAIRMNVTLSTTRIYFEIEPELEVRLRIENNARSVDIGPCIIPSDFYTYLPENASQIRMYLYPSYKRNSAFPSARYSYIVVWNEGPKDYTIQSSFPFFAFFLFGINGTQLLLVIIAIGAIIASLVSLHRLFDKQPFRNIFSHPEFISFALALVGILAPWLSWDIVKFDNGIRSYQFEWLINPIGVALEGGSDRLITSIPSEHLNVSTFHFVFWISLIAVGLRMMNVYYTETSFGFYAPYLVMGLSGVGA
ncbi:MAG: hypothetical protein KAU48_07980, partial [Candidatus Thorarchaeota archaeon]|nr:hypothetical protein [Candidatus Thorarchaeota archaeon]